MKDQWTLRWNICMGMILLTAFFGNTFLFAAPGDTAKIVKVGYVENYGVITNQEDMSKRGYGYDYLEEIAKYTGWRYEYIPCSWDEGLEKLRTGEIDLFGPLHKTPEREQYYDYPFREMGFEYGAIYVPQGKKIYYDDAASIDGLRIGSEKNNFYKAQLDEYCRVNNIQITYVDATVDSFQQGMANGAFDAVCEGSLVEIPDTSVAVKISSDPNYFATTKGNQEVLEGLNQAVAQIFKKDAYFAVKLDQLYYGAHSISLPLFTREEDAFLQTQPVLKVVGDPRWAPIEYFDAVVGRHRGITIDILKEIQRQTGIVFEFVKTDSYTQSMAMIRDGSADLLIGYTEYAQDLSLAHSKDFLKVPVIMVGRKDDDAKQTLRAAMPTLQTSTAMKIMKKYPHFIFTEYPDMQSSRHSLDSNRERYAFINAYEFSEITREESPENFVTISTAIDLPLNIGIAAQVSPVVIDILNKSIDRLRPEQLSAIVFANTVSKPHTVSLNKIFRDYAMPISVALSAVFCLVIFLIYYNNKKVKDKLENIAYRDDITGLLTAAKFKLDAQKLMKTAKPFQYTILTMDIDHFKYINDSFGYATGSLILQGVAEHLKKYIAPNELLGRANADLFIMMIQTRPWEELRTEYQEMTNIGERLSACLSSQYHVAFSAGAYAISGNEDINNMLDKANIARKSSKSMYENTIAEYTKDMDGEIEWKKQVTLYMEHALANEEFVVYLQPKFLFKDEKIVGAEALVRWNHPQKGLIAPGMFIPIFEKNGFIQKIDLYVFERVCALMKAWENSHLSNIPIAVSVNLSRLHLANHQLVEELIALTKKYDVRPEQLELELTESMLFGSIDVIVNFMQRLKDVGFRISIDDFGSGYSSLSLLKDLPADVLKIDKGFLDESADTTKGRLILSSVIDISRKVHMTTVAEGVETIEQADFLRGIGCDIAQGYYYARPMPAEEFEKLILAQAKS